MLTCSDLWPEFTEDRARANLRRALWRLPAGWVVPSGPDLVLNAEVDFRDASRIASSALESRLLDADQIKILTRDLLPGWYEDWVLSEQDQYHLRRIQALEEACRTAARARQFWLATTAGLAAVCAEPLRESAVTVLVEAHLLEGNRFEAARRYRAYEERLRRELDAEPGAELHHMMASCA
jgi:DNA-binding SARP family transcriptional activator